MPPRLAADSRREQILRCARDVFAESGYDGARTGAIARRAGVSERLLYKHFPGKRELFIDVALAVAQGLADLYRAVSDEELSLQGGIRRLHAARFASPDDPARGMQLFLGRSHGPFDDPVLNEAMGRAYRIMDEGGTAYFARLKERGLLRSDADPRAAAWMLASVFREYGAIRLAQPPDRAGELSDRILAQFARGLAAFAPGEPDGPPGLSTG